MSSRVEEPRVRGSTSKLSGLHEKIAHFYYSFGLFCSTYPISIICLAIFTTLMCCYPLSHLQLVGTVPQQIWGDLPNTTTENLNVGPFCYVQQVVLRVAVLPWEPHLTLKDAFRAPLYESFKLLEVIRNYEDEKSSKTLSHFCLHVESVHANTKDDILPQYSCLVLSPANLWRQDVLQFTKDKSILTTIFNYQNLQKGKTSLAEMLFGMQLKDTGIKRYPLRTRQRVIQYAVTLFFKEYDEGFIKGLKHKLQSIYPLHQHPTTDTNNSSAETSTSFFNDIVHIYYPRDVNYYEFIPLIICLFVLLLYYYFSVRKIEFIKSKFGMAFTAVMTVLGSLSMTLGVCFFFGLTLSLHGKEIFPYLVILVGLENVLVLTKSILSTPSNLDAKIRVAQGLSKEGWSITKNLLLEITILTFGLFTFVPSIQELCIFAIVGLISDFFLQMFFFSTILGIDVRRMENLVEKSYPNFANSLSQNHINYNKSVSSSGTGMFRSKSHPRLSSFHNNAPNQNQPHDKKVPKRIRLVNIWARTRFFQRAFMILMVVWIGMILYESEFIHNYLFNKHLGGNKHETTSSDVNYSSINISPLLQVNSVDLNSFVNDVQENVAHTLSAADLKKLRHPEYAPWMRLSTKHWQAILRKYNVSLVGQYVAILPTIGLSYVVRPEQAIMLRNPEEKYENFQWQALAAALDPIDFSDLEGEDLKSFQKSERPLFPSTPMEILLTTILCLISVAVLSYLFVVLYRCICSRNYAEWRASWFDKRADDGSDTIPVLLEVMPVTIKGHEQEIECIASDGFTIASSCLKGQVKVWDVATGELLAVMDRNQDTSIPHKLTNDRYNSEDNLSDYESGSPPSRDEQMNLSPENNHKINLNFSKLTLEASSKFRRCGRSVESRDEAECEFDFGKLVVTSNCDGDETEAGKVVQIWCMDYIDNLIAVGCANGQIEFWEGTTGKLKCVFEDGSGIGVTSIKNVGSQVIVARLHGNLDFLRLQTYNHGKPIDWNFTCAYRRTHIRTGSAGSISDHRDLVQGSYEDLRCLKISTVKAHQQLITCLDSEGGRVLTGSQDHTLKLFRLKDGGPLYTLHGHCGPITCLFIDRVNSATSASGSQDGMLCVWDLLTGACMYSLQAHDGLVHSLTYSASYIISLGSDERLCIWERFQGHLLNTIHLSNSFSCQITMLTPHLVVTTRGGALVVWDVRTGDCVRTITLGHSPLVCVKSLVMLRDSVLCDYGKQLRIVRFPLINHKYD